MRKDIIESLPFRIFSLEVDGVTEYWVHRFKTAQDFSADLRSYQDESKNLDPATITKGLTKFLDNEGYVNVADLTSEQYNAEIVSTRSRLIPRE